MYAEGQAEHDSPSPRPADPRHGQKVERFAQLLATCQRRVFLYALSLVHNAADAEEILQETNLVLWRKFDEFRPGSDFARWACRIAHFEVLKYRERKSGREKLFSDSFIESLAVAMERSFDLLDARREALSGCLTKLPERDRRLIHDRYEPRATTRSVAEAAGRSVQGTRKALHRIREALLACVERTLAAEEHL
jgi:RNA polymerase sigma-70 factor (ECF subfamily)